MAPRPSLSLAEFAAIAARAGLSLAPEQLAAMYEVYGHVEAMRAAVRKPRDIAAEPAHVFAAARDADR